MTLHRSRLPFGKDQPLKGEPASSGPMRARWGVLAAAAFLLSAWAPIITAHGDGPGFRHLSVEVRHLNASESRDLPLASDEGPFREGWVFIVYGGVEGPAPVVVNLTFGDVVVEQWVWVPGDYHKNTTRLKHSGEHHLTFWNPSSNASTRYVLYYDQSCNCEAKSIPLPGGFVLFNYDLPAGRDVLVAFPSLPNWTLRGAVATLDGAGTRWPDDFTLLTNATVSGRGWLNFTFTTPHETRYYVFVEAVDGASLEDPVFLRPLVEVAGPATPFPSFLAGIVALVAGLAAFRRRDGQHG
jgi:hypothetical protein